MKLLYILYIVFILLNIGHTNSYALSKEDTIVEFIRKNQRLDEEIFQKLTFRLSGFQPVLGGQNAKCILKGSDDKLWFFKIKDAPAFLDIVYRWFWLCGADVPVCHNIRLSINGKYEDGGIQEFMPDMRTIANVAMPRFSKSQIEYIQRQQIMDWFIFSEGVFECDPEQFLFKADTVVNVGKYKAFCPDYAVRTLIADFNNLGGRENYYNLFWQAYVKRDIEVDFNKSFELIEYIQNLDDRAIEALFRPVVKGDFPLSMLIERKHRLRFDFEEYYRYLAVQRGDILNAPFSTDNPAHFSKRTTKKIEDDIRKKERILMRLNKTKNDCQKNIEVILSTEMREILKKFSFPDGFYHDNIMAFKKTLNNFKEKLDNPNEKLALYLFLYQMKHIANGITDENFFEVSPLAAYSPETIDIQMIESALRVAGYEDKGFYIDTIDEFIKDDKEIITHILYILTTSLSFGEYDEVLNRYQKRNLGKELQRILDILNIASIDKNYIPRTVERLKTIEDTWVWKHFLLSFLYYQMAFWHNGRDFKDSAILELTRVIRLTKDKRLLYITYLFLGYLYEHNKNCFRFGEGFSVNAAIDVYERALEIKPDSTIAYLNLATLYLIKKNPDKAWRYFDNIAKSDCQYAIKHFNFGENFYREFRKLDKSRKIEMLKTHSLDDEQKYILGLIYSLK